MSAAHEDPGRSDPLEPVLREAEDELQRRLREACDTEARGIANESSAEIRRLEDALLAAAAAAEETLALRRHIERRSAGEAPTSAERTARAEAGAPPTTTTPLPEEISRVREFRDAEGQLWRAWPVTPGRARSTGAAERYLGEFHNGWICFEALQSAARRRLPRQPPNWSELDDAELTRLLDEAITAPVRKPRPLSESS